MPKLRAVALTLILGVAVALIPAPDSSAQQKFDSLAMDRSKDILHDAYDCVKKNYYDPHYHGLDWDARYHEYQEKMKTATSLGQAFSIVAAFLNGLNDTHTAFLPPSRPYRLNYGYQFQIYGDKAYITHVRPGTDAVSKVHPGDEVVTYNNYSVNRADFEVMNYYFNLLAPRPAMDLDLRDPAGQQRQVQVQAKVQQLKKLMDLTSSSGGADLWQLIRQGENSDRLRRSRYYEMGDVTIWKMPIFNLDDSEVDHAFGTVRKHKTLILDLRGNPGGYTVTLERMLGNVFDRDVKISDRVGRKSLKPQLAKTRGGGAFGGKIIVLVDSDSASSSELFARVMQLEHRGTVIGDRTAGAVMEAAFYPYSQGMDTRIFYDFEVTHADLIMADGKSLEHVGVVPDEVVLPTAQDLAAGRDPALSRAAALAGLNIDPAAAGKMFPFEWLPFGS